MPQRALRHGGLLLALLLSAALAVYERERLRVGYTRYDLPTFDAYVYVTMADEPAFFTAAPWGYRLLGPRIVHLFPPRARLAAFQGLALACVVGSGGLLFLFLRRLGHREAIALVGVALLLLSRPVRLALEQPMLGEPLALLLELAALLAIAAGAGLLTVGALLALGMLAKELFLLLPPLLLLQQAPRDGFRRALGGALLAAAPAFAVFVLLRLWWTPRLHVPSPPFDLALLRAGADVFVAEWRETTRALLLSGVMPLALLGAATREARPYLKTYGYLAALCVALSLFAWINVPSRVPVPLFGANTERLLLYALPLLIPLALIALERALRLGVAAAPAALAAPKPRLLRLLAVPACGFALLLPLFGVDRYRRVPLHERRDGPLLMALCQESLRAARRLERGEEVLLDPAELRFAWGISDPGRLFEMRWFLREGWGRLAHYGVDDVRMREASASLLLPCLRPRPLLVTLELEAPETATFDVSLNGAALGRAAVGPGLPPLLLRVPAQALFRGDNLLTLASSDGAPRAARLKSYRLRAES